MKAIGAVNRITVDMMYSNLQRIPGMGEEVSTDTFILTQGGGPSAALVTASRLGAEGRLATSLGDDYFSGIAKSFLQQEALPYASFYTGSGGIPVNITSVMTFEDRDRSFISYFSKEPFFEAFANEMYEYLQGVSLCISCMSSEPSEVLFFQKLRRAGCKIVYDIGWRDDLSLDSLKETLKEVYLFTPNEKEALKITGACDAEEALKILSRYVTQPVIKLGKQGALVWKDGGGIFVPAFDNFYPVDSTGAGDAFLGGVSYGLLQGWDILRCVELGNYTGGKATTALGCLTARPSLEEYESLAHNHNKEKL